MRLIKATLLVITFALFLIPAIGLAQTTPPGGGYRSQAAHTWCAKPGCSSYLATETCWLCHQQFCSAHVTPIDHAEVCKQ